jgi:uncharacterized membrane protein
VLFGALTATSVYALVVLAQVSSRHVPRLSVTLAIVFVVLSTGAILRILAELREVVTGGGLVRAVGLRLHAALDHEWREPGHPAPGPPPERGTDDADVTTARGGVVQHIDAAALAETAARLGVHVTCLVAVGGFVDPGAPILRVSPAPRPPAGTRDLSGAVRLGPSRRTEHDPPYSLRLLADVAIRALSPAVNDPTTAVQALDQIESALLRIAERPLGPLAVRDPAGATRVTVPRPGWRALLDTLDRTVPPARAAALTPYRAALDRTASALKDPVLIAAASIPDTQGLGGPDPRAYTGDTH